ncbi:AraC family transcriptional regulator [Microvirga mediterraneensis]|uniref:AraC family transcriptional regulator ligand-binding domain-containing protein n=1 Tax=Microvirga mediterraneensis TaxID=2754695 RepID=A0A838BNI8_9HYPH|nr:AraC family transcriptional regulator [Microvirga mediterraneensis]MBA1156016.1 AraC family transcriptional regulator ligand-binding domain-containing protein [Microvirga mediterraneensis]
MPAPLMEPLVDGMAWSGFDHAVRHARGGAAAVFQAIDVPLTVIDRPGKRMEFRKYVAFFEVAARLTGDPLFGLRFGAGTRAPRSGLPGYLVMNARSCRDAIRDLAWTLPTLVGGVQVELVEDREPPAILWSIVADIGPATQFTSHANAYFVRMLQAHRGRSWRPIRVLYAMPEPKRADRYREILGCPVLFDAPVNAIEIRRDDLRAEKTDGDPRLHALLSTYAQYLSERDIPAAGFDGLIRMAIRDGITLGQADLSFVAERLKMSRRSLQRALAGRGLSFSELRDDERFALARSLLETADRPIGEIAAHLGYAEVSAFSRAFRHRFGMSPRSARRRASVAPGSA